MKKSIPVIGMACAACAANVERRLRSLDGVSDASVSLPTRTAVVEYDEQAITPEDMKREVNAIGFDLVTDDEQSVVETERREYVALRRKVMVSWVFAILVMAVGMGWIPTGSRDAANQTSLLIALANLLYCGKEFFVRAIKQLCHLTASMDTLVALSTGISFLFSALNTFAGDQLWGARGMAWHTYFDASVMIITFVLTGRLLEQHARKSTASAIRQLMGLTPKTARLYKGKIPPTIPGEPEGPGGPDKSDRSDGSDGSDGKEDAGLYEEVPIATIQPGDVVEVTAGGRIPVDGSVRWATSFMTSDGAYVDESMITGEPSPVLKQESSSVLAGTIVSQGKLLMRARKTGEDTALAQIIRMVEQAQGSKAPVQRTVDRISLIFVPAVAAIALVTFLTWWVAGGSEALPQAIMSAVAVLVVACPCALGLATPTSLMVGIGKAAQQGILIKDATALERIERIDAMVIDKTGTLTIPNPAIDFTKADQLPLDERETLKPHAREAMETLRKMGVEVHMMSGDREEAAAYWAQQAGIPFHKSRVQPQDKENLVRQLQAAGHRVAMVGDGINDSQALATADVSIAMGRGTDVAIDVAQMTLMGDDLRRIPEALTLSQRTVSMIHQNLFWAFIYNVTCIPLAAGVLRMAGIDFLLTPTWASALMACSSLSVVLNSLRLRWSPSPTLPQ